MMQAVAGYLIKSAAILQLRNQATYQDGDIAPIGVDDKYPLYMQLAQQLESDAQATFLQVKMQNNLEGMYGSLGSSYAYVGRYRY
jgi:zona occludens toxin (predicted ATPase)